MEAVDGSSELCNIASSFIGKNIRQLMFEELDYVEMFDAVWVCASLLHIPKAGLPNILHKIGNALKENGIIYASFKYGNFSGERNGRFLQTLQNKVLMR